MDQIEILRRDRDPLMREYQALTEQIRKGHPTHPFEVRDMMRALVEEGYQFQAEMLGEMEVNWDLG